jgi:hypothetical protein
MISKFTVPLHLIWTVLYCSLDIYSVQGWCIANCMKLNINRTKVITFSRKINVLIYEYKRCHSSISRSYSIKDMGVVIDAGLHFHGHTNYIFSQCVKLLGIVHGITFNFSSLECLLRLYIALVSFKMEYSFVVWNSVTSTDANKLERIQQSFVQVHYCYSLALTHFTYQEATPRFSLSYPSLLWFKILSVRFGNCWSPRSCSVYQRLRIVQYLLFMKNCPFARCASAANNLCKDADVFEARNVLLNRFILYIFTPIYL